MATRIVPLPAAGQQLLEDVYKHPSDMGLRLILADCLEDAGDPRAGLVRLLPQLLSLPKREKPRNDVPCRVWKYGNPWLYSTRKEWPSLQIHHVEGVGWYGRGWTGLHNAGRLLWIALVHAYLDFIWPIQGDHEKAWLRDVEPIGWAYACRLISPQERIALRRARLARPVNGVGRFRAYLPWAEKWITFPAVLYRGQQAPAMSMVFDKSSPQEQVERGQQSLTNQGTLWSRWLDIRDALVQLCPWQDAWQAYLQSRVPKPERGSPAWRVRKSYEQKWG